MADAPRNAAGMRDGVEVHNEIVAVAAAAIQAATQTTAGQMSEAQSFLADTGGTAPGAFREVVTPGPADQASAT